MKALKLYTGNRLELLAELLAKVLEVPPASPLEPEIIVVQSKGMERWLSLQLAAHFGVCANCRFPFPNALIHEAFRSVLPDLSGSSLFEPKYAAWKITQLLPDHLDEPGFASLKHYLDHSPRDLRRLQLASHLAETFDQYVLYRPDLISRWEQGRDDHWQAVLWRDLAKGLEHQHRAALGRAFLERIRQAAPSTFPLPQRISLFGISYLPPFHLQILDGLAQMLEVNLFLLNPCREYWGDIASKREIGRLASRPQHNSRDPAELYLDEGNPLLASMGTLGRDFLEVLASFPCEESSVFQGPGEESLLACLQSDILNLRDRTRHRSRKTAVLPEDRSFEVHSCHSPMREVEVLYDHLLELFEQDPSLLPRDILVMAPAIETYAPFIQAVFDTPEDERKHLPYAIADRGMRRESQMAEAFLALLDLWDARLTAAEVHGLLESPAIRARFGLADTDLDLIAGWTQEVRIRWGIDEQDRLRWLPHAFRENTWRAGLDQLLLGYAMPGNGHELFCGVLPYDRIEGSEVTVLGRFAEFAEQLFQLLASLRLPRTLHQWSEALTATLSRFFLPGDAASREFQAVRQVILELTTIQELTNFTEPVDIRVIKWHLERQLERQGFGFGFLTGGVTCCSMLPMRSIPFRVICLLGMDSNSFPRQAKAPDFDLMAKHPRRGDRSPRNDDRYLFLEALISAREKLYISYTGQSARDNSSIPPSVLVSELLDYVHQAFTFAGGRGGEAHFGADAGDGVPPGWEAEAPMPPAQDNCSCPLGTPGNTSKDARLIGNPQPATSRSSDDPERFIIKHRLQPFNAAYFKGGRRLFSYSEEWLGTARCLLQEQTPPPPFLAAPLAAPEETLKHLDLARLCRFFVNPARFFLDRRLGMVLDEERTVLDETECFEMAGLEQYALGQTLLAARMAGHDLTVLYPPLKASGMLPHGVPGELAFKSTSGEVERFARRVEPYLHEGELEPLVFELPVADFTLTGSIPSLYRHYLVRYRYATIKAKDLLNLWIPHLVLNLIGDPAYPRESLLMGLDEKGWCALTYTPVANSRELLDKLLAIYWSGLSKPLPFFPETSLHFAEHVLLKGTPPEKALAAAEAKWTGDFHRGEGQDLSCQLCFNAVNPLDAEFERLAVAVFGPLLTCRKEH